MRRLEHRLGEGPRRIEPVAAQPDIIFAPLNPLDRQPVDEIRIDRATDPAEQRDPRAKRIAPPAKPVDRTVDPRPGLRIEPVGRVFKNRFKSPGERGKRLGQRFQRLHRRRRSIDQRAVGIGQLGFEPVARLLRLGPRVDRAARLVEQALDRAERIALGQPRDPAVGWQEARRLDRRIERLIASLVIAAHVQKPRGQAASAAPGFPLRPDDPAPHLDRFLAGQRDRKSRIGGVEQMMAFVEQDPRRCIGAPARGIDHHQGMIGDDDIGFAPGAFGALDEAFAIMRAAGIDAFAAAIGQRRCTGAAEQARQPAGQIATDHIAVLGVSRPAPDEVGEDRRPPRERALHRILEVEQAQIILTALADHDLVLPLGLVGEQFMSLGIELALQRLGEGRHPHRPPGAVRPQCRRSEIGERLADPGSRLGEQHVGLPRRAARCEQACGLGGHRPLAKPRLGPGPGQLGQLGFGLGTRNIDRARRRALGRLVPLRQPREQHPLAAFGLGNALGDERRPRPAQPVERPVGSPRAFALAPVGIAEMVEQGGGNGEQSACRIALVGGRIDPHRARQARHRRHREPRRMDEGEQFQQVEPRDFGGTQPLPDRRRVEQHMRSLGEPPDRLAPRRFAHLSIHRNPDAGMGCMERGKGQRNGHDGQLWRCRNERATVERRYGPRGGAHQQGLAL